MKFETQKMMNIIVRAKKVKNNPRWIKFQKQKMKSLFCGETF